MMIQHKKGILQPMRIEHWKTHEFSSGGQAGDDYREFQREYRALLSKQIKASGFILTTFSGNHYEFSAVIQSLQTKTYYYISISDVRFFKNEWNNKILWREMRHAKDWTGLHNQRSSLDELFENIICYDEKKPKS